MGLKTLLMSLLGVAVITTAVVVVVTRQELEVPLLPNLELEETGGASTLLGQAVGGIPINNYSISQSNVGAILRHDQHNIMRCAAGVDAPLIGTGAPSQTNTRYWGYKYSGRERNNKNAGKIGRELFDGDFFISQYELTFVNQSKLNLYNQINVLNRVTGPNMFYFMSTVDMCFICGQGLRPAVLCPGYPGYSSSSSSSSSFSSTGGGASSISSSSVSSGGSTSSTTSTSSSNTSGGGGSSSQSSQMEAGLAACIGFDEGTGATAADRTGAHNGTISGATWTADVESTLAGSTRALAFDATDVMTLANSATFDYGYSSPFSVSAWVKLSDTTLATVASKLSGNQGWALAVQNGRIVFGISENPSNAVIARTAGGILAGSYYHILATYDGSGSANGIRIYVYGAEQTPLQIVTNNPAGSPFTTEPVRLSGISGSSFNGTIDELRLYNRAVTPDETLWETACNALPNDIFSSSSSSINGGGGSSSVQSSSQSSSSSNTSGGGGSSSSSSSSTGGGGGSSSSFSSNSSSVSVSSSSISTQSSASSSSSSTGGTGSSSSSSNTSGGGSSSVSSSSIQSSSVSSSSSISSSSASGGGSSSSSITGGGGSSSSVVVGICGNGIQEGIEQCDDGNQVDGDGCFEGCLTMVPPSDSSAGVYGPIARWRLDEGDGVIVTDSYGNHDGLVGYGCSLVSKNAPQWSADTPFPGSPSSLLFDGVQDIVEIEDSGPFSRLDLGENGAVSLWVKINALPTGTVPKTLLQKGTNYTMHLASNGRVYVRNNTNYTTPPLTLNTWHHIVYTYDSAQLYLYLDGTLAYSIGLTTPSLPVNDESLFIGRATYDHAFTTPGSGITQKSFAGYIDDIALYNRILTAADVATEYGNRLLCGNSQLDPAAGEECDDGNHADGDGCFANCLTMVPPNTLGSPSISPSPEPFDPFDPQHILHLAFNGTDRQICDVSGHGNDAAVPPMTPILSSDIPPVDGNTSALVTPRYGSVAYGNGIGMFNDSTLNFTGTNALSIAFWVKSLGEGGDIDVLAVSKSTGYDVIISQNKISFGPASATYQTTAAIPYDSQYHHILVTYDGQAAAAERTHIYIDGIDQPLTLPSTPPGPADVIGSTGNLRFGDVTFSASALFDDLRIYRRVVSPSDIPGVHASPFTPELYPPAYDIVCINFPGLPSNCP